MNKLLDEKEQKRLAEQAFKDITEVLALQGINYLNMPEKERMIYFSVYQEGMVRALRELKSVGIGVNEKKEFE